MKYLFALFLVFVSHAAFALDAACIGASNTGTTSGSPYASGTAPADSYCKKISDAFGYSSMTNYAQSGATFDDRTIYDPDKPGIETQLNSAISAGKDITFVACCANDFLDEAVTEASMLSTYRSNIEGLVSTAETNSMPLVFFAEPMTNNGWYNERIRAGNAVTKDVSEDNGIPYIDVWSKMENDARISSAAFTGWFLSDGLHLNATGHQNFANVVIASQFAQATGGGGGGSDGNLYTGAIDGGVSSLSGYTAIVIIQPSAMNLPSGSPSFLDIFFKSGASEANYFDKVYIGHLTSVSGANPNKTIVSNDLTQVTKSSSGAFEIPTSTEVQLDRKTFAYNKTSALVIKFYMSNSSKDFVFGHASVSGVKHYISTGDTVTTASDSGYSEYDYSLAVSKISADGY